MVSLTDTPKTFVVLGVHRSGTSFIARCLYAAGVTMRGYYPRLEDGVFVGLNKTVIQEAGGIWRNPPSVEALLEQTEKFGAHFGAAVDTLNGDLRGWKDPRQALTLEGFVPWLTGDVYLVALFRKPDKVGASLARLGQTTVAHGTEMAREYDRRIIRAIRRFVGIEGG